jgi:Spy/CpxP family protein refolding chaperone
MTSRSLGRRVLVAAAALMAGAPVLVAQTATDSAPLRRGVAMEQRVRERVAAVVQNRLQLTDDQMRKLRDVNAKYEPQRRKLLADERDARIVLRAELQRGKNGDQSRVSTALDKMLKTQRSRLDVAEQEQRDLSAFLSPSQRAGYLAIQEQIRRRVDEMRQRNGAGRGLGKGVRPGPG